MARKKQPLKRTSSTSGSGAVSPTTAASSTGQAVALPSTAQDPDNPTAPAISPNEYFTSDKGDYRMPKITEPLAYLTVLWRRYEATFAISMFETWESVLLHSMLLVLSYGIYWASTSYLPDHMRVIAHRAKYYWFGTEESGPF